MASLPYVPLSTSAEVPKAGLFESLRAKWTSTHSSLETIFEDNAGILLIMVAQLFFALVNVAVKTLNGIDPPVDTLQVLALRLVLR